MRALLIELGHVLRSLRRRPGHAVASVVLMTCGMTIALIMFEGLNGYILRPLPVPDPDRLLHLGLSRPQQGTGSMGATLHDFRDWRAQQRSFEDLAAYYLGTVNVGGIDRPERFNGAFVTASFFEVLRARPALGRRIMPHDLDPGGELVVVLGHGAWVRSFGADPGVVGRPVRVNGRAGVIVGVMAEGFALPEDEQVWVPLSLDIAGLKRGEGTRLEVIGRLREGTSADRARAEMASIVDGLARQYPETNSGEAASIVPLAHRIIDRQTRLTVAAMFVVALLVFLIACANVANLTLARIGARTREISVRASLGATPWRLSVPIVVECGLISVTAGAFALILSRSAMEAIASTLRATDATFPSWVHFGTDWRSLAFVLTVALTTTLLAGLVPALRVMRRAPASGMRVGARGIVGTPLGRMSRWLVAVEIALACVVILSATSMVRTAVNVQRVNLGADIDNVLTGRVGLFEGDYPNDESRVAFFDDLERALGAVPGVAEVALTTSLPGTYAYGTTFAVEGLEPEEGRQPSYIAYAAVSPGYFGLFRVPIRDGRDFSSADRAGSPPVVIVNALMASRIDPSGGSVVGRRLRFGTDGEAEWLTIVGVVPNVLQSRIDEQSPPTAYLPLAQSPVRFASFAARTEQGAGDLSEAVRRAVRAVDPNLPVYWLRPLTAAVGQRLVLKRFLASMLGAFAGVGLLLAAAGLFAVLAATVSERVGEIGVRRALGARGADVVALFGRHGRWPLLIGIVSGLVLGQGPARMLEDELVGVTGWDPVTLAGTVVVVLAVTALAAMLPVRRSLRVDPVEALRCE